MQSLRIFIKIIAMFILFLYAQENVDIANNANDQDADCLLYTSPSPRDRTRSRMPSSA